MRRQIGPRLMGDGAPVDGGTQRRTRALVAAIGLKKAAERLRMGQETIESACHGSRVQRKAADRLVAALDREEPLLEAAS